MNKESVIDALITLATGLKDRPKVAQLREVYPYIEAAKSAGFKNSKIVETLNAHGFDLTLKAFEMLLYRIRAAAKASAANTPRPPASHFQPEKGTHQNQPRSLTPSPESNAPADHQGSVIDGLAGLDKKQRRERLGEQFINPEVTNTFLKQIKDKNQ